VGTTPLRVVVADDDDHIAELIRTALDADDRFTVVARAATGDEAIELTGERHPDLVLMDISMPSCDGIEATRLIHELDAGMHIVIYTSSEDFGKIARAEAAGASGFLHKDVVTTAELADALFVLHANHVRGLPDPD